MIEKIEIKVWDKLQEKGQIMFKIHQGSQQKIIRNKKKEK